MSKSSSNRKSNLLSQLLRRKNRKRTSNWKDRARLGEHSSLRQFESLENRLLLAVFSASKDTSLFQESVGNTAGGDQGIFAGTIRSGSFRRGLIGFDLSSIPAGSTVTAATLDLAVTKDPGGPTPAHNFSLHRLTQDWGEGAVVGAGAGGGQGAAAAAGDATWSHAMFSTVAWTAAGGDFDATASATTSVGNEGTTATWSSAGLIADIQAWVDTPGSNFGWIIVGDESASTTARRFGSNNHATAASRPILDVTFTAAEPTVSLAVDNATIPEDAGVATVTATLSATSTQDVTVDLAYSGSALNGTDYTASGAQIVIAAGATTGSVTITATQDVLPEVDETVVVDIDTVTNATESDTQQVTTAIVDDDAEPTVNLLVDNATIAENNGSAQLTAVLSGVSGADVTVDLTYTGTATIDADYTAPSQIVIPAGALNASITVAAIQDVVFDEGDETIVATISNVTNASGAAEQTITIVDDDITPTVSLAVDNASFAEAVGQATITATLSVVSGVDVTIDLAYSGTATITDDYNAPSQLVITAGNLNATGIIATVPDNLDEDDETVVVDITAVTNANEAGEQQVSTTIVDDDDPPEVTLSVDNGTIDEGGEAILTATLSATSGRDVTVDLGIGGSATDPDDYTLSGTQIVVPAGSQTGSITLSSVQDTLDENDETVSVEITDVVNATESDEQQQTVTITDDDDPPTVVLSVDTTEIAEDGGVATFTATLSTASSFPVTVDLTVGGTATVTDDYTVAGNQIVIAAGATSGSVTVSAVDDAVVDPGETVVVDIATVTNGTEDGEQQATVTIVDNDEPDVTLSVDTATIAEAAGVATFTATLSAPSTLAVTVDLSVSGSATATDDYTLSGTQIVIPAGATSGSITVTAVDDLVDEPDETVVVDIASVVNGLEEGEQQQTTTIQDDDEPIEVSLSVDNASIAEAGGVAMFIATLSSVAGQDVTVDLGISGTATDPDDYTISGTQIVIAAGATTGGVAVTAVDDALDEPDETVVVDITGIVNGVAGGAQQQSATITDDDDPPTVTLAVDSTTIAEDAGVATLTATLSAASGQDVTIEIATTGTATVVDDYALGGTPIVIPAGETTGSATVTAVQDTVDEDDETVIVDIEAVTNGTELDTQQQTVTITDDDDPEVALTVDLESIPEEAGVATFIATLSSASDQAVTIDLELTGTATLTDDYTSSGTQIVIPAAATSGSVTVTAVQDSLDEADETIIADVSAVTNAQEVGDQQATTTIQDDDDPPTVVLSIDEESIPEAAGVATVTATISEVSGQDVTLDLVFSGAAGAADFTASATQLVIPAGATSGAITITAVQDFSPEGDETVIVDIDTATNAVEDGTQQVSTTIVDDDPLPTLSLLLVRDTIVENNGTTQLTAFMSGQSGVDVVVDLEYTGTATLDEDFSAPSQIIIPAGGLNASITIAAIQDAIDEEDETIVATVTNITGATGAGGATITILDDDVTPDVTISIDRSDIIESVGQATVAVFLSTAANQPVTVTLEYAGTATLDEDFTGPAEFTIGVGGLNAFGLIRSISDTLDEPDETVIIGIASVTNANEVGEQTAMTNILDDDGPPTVTLSVDNDTIAEADGVATFTATLSEASGQDVTVNLEVTGTATEVDDYTAATQIVIPAGELSGNVTVNAVDDTVDEPDETVIVTIAEIINGAAGGAQQQTTTILDDDEAVPPDVSIAVDNAEIPEEAGVATFTVTLSAATSVDVTVDLALSGTAAASDYTASATQVVIPVGSTSGSITVTAVQDTEDEQNETVIVDIDTVTGGNEAGTQQATTTITDDDGPASFAVSTFEATSTGFNAVLNAAIDVDDLNLYDTSAGLGAADVVLTGATTGPVAGTLVIAADNQTISFIATGGVLAADTYTATLRSAADGFEDTTARLLDGNGDGTAGDDYTSEFTVAAPVPNAVTLSLPDIVRGPGQPVNVPADATTGLPLSISEGAGVRNVTVSLDYDPAFLEITAAAVGANMPAGSAVTLDTSTAGTALLTFTSPVDLPAGANTLVDLTAAVPTADANAIYRSKQVLNLHSASVTDGSAANIPVIDDDALHAIEYFADVSGNGRVNAADASQVAQFAALLVDGFAASQNADPVVVGDVSGNGRVNAADASQVAQVAALIPVGSIPAVPAGVVSTPITGGPDPKLSLPKDVTAAAGETFTVALELDSIENLQAPNRIGSGSVIVDYDANVLTATNVTPGSFITSNGWSIVPNIATPGRVIVVAFGTNAVGGQFVDTFLNFEFTVNAAAPAGPTALNIIPQAGAFTELLSESDQPLPLIPPPTAADNDEIDGLVTITGGGPTVSLAVDNASIAEAGGVATFTATLSETVTSDVTVDLGLTGTATDPDDYTASGNQIVIAAGATSGSITVTAVDDTVDDDDETVIVDITNVTGAAENGEQQATTTITDDDEPVELPTVSLAVDNADIAEAGGVATVTATLSAAATADVTVELGLSGTATNPDDYTASGTQIVIAAGATSGSVTVTAVDDAIDDDAETVIVDITSVVGANEAGEQQVTTTITDDDEPAVEPGNRLTISKELQAAPGAEVAVPVNIELVNLPVGQRLLGIGAVVSYDAAILELTSVDNGDFVTSNTGWTLVPNTGTPGQAVLVGFTTTPTTGPLSQVLATLNFTVLAGAPAGPTSLNLVDGFGPARTELLDEGDNLIPLADAVTADPGDRADGVLTVVGTAGPTVSLAVDNASIAEAGGVATFTATLSETVTSDVTVDLGLTGTATDPDDYTASGNQIVIAAGATSGSITVTAVDDTVDDDDETVIVDITNVTGAAENGEQQATTTITDDDEPALPTVSLAVDNADIAEAGGVATFTATLSAAATADVTVDLGLSGTATNPDDYTASGTQIVIATGATSGSVTVTAVDDTLDEENETVVADITNVVGATEDGEQQATTTITDDDEPVLPTVSLSVDNEAIAEAGGVATFTATLSAAATADVTVDLGFTGTAANAADYTASGTQIVIAAGSTSGSITVTAIDDTLDEEDETVVVDITNVTGATGTGAAITTITDDDELGPNVSLSVDSASIAEAGGVATLTATLSEVLTSDVVVDLAYSGTATSGTDYTASATQLTIAAGATTASATVTALQDTEVEVDETVIVDITVTGAAENGEQQVTVTIGDDDGVNDPPDLENPGDQSFAETQDTFDVTLVATDPNPGDTLTYSATVEGGELYLDQTLDLNFTGDFFTNFSGLSTAGRVELNEKWLLGGDGRTWYYIEPSGDFYRWLGSGVLNREFVAQVSTAAYDDPALLYDAQPGGVTSPVTASVVNNVVTLDPPAGFTGSFTVVATVSDGERTDIEMFLVQVEPNQAPELENPGDQTLPTTQDTLDVPLVATDPMDDAITLTAEVQSGEYYLDQTIGFQVGPGGLFPNWSGTEDERWLLADDGETWYFITPDGSFYRWLAQGDRNIMANSELVAQLSPATHADPALLHDAQPGAAVPAVVSVNGTTLTIDPNAGFVGTFGVLLTATDVGGLTDSEWIRVDVTASPAKGIQIPLSLGRPSAAPSDASVDRALQDGELGFNDSLLGTVPSGHEDAPRSSDSDTAFEQLLDEDLIDEDLLEDLVSDL